MLIISTIFTTSAFSGTIWLDNGVKSPSDGFLVSYDALDQCIKTKLDYNSLERKYDTDINYYSNKFKVSNEKCDLDKKAIIGQYDAQVKVLKEDLVKYKVWYRQPWFVGGVTFVGMILIGGYIAK